MSYLLGAEYSKLVHKMSSYATRSLMFGQEKDLFPDFVLIGLNER